jgi:hypothetical protein
MWLQMKAGAVAAFAADERRSHYWLSDGRTAGPVKDFS